MQSCGNVFCVVFEIQSHRISKEEVKEKYIPKITGLNFLSIGDPQEPWSLALAKSESHFHLQLSFQLSLFQNGVG